jgi:hypothetical protein
MDPTDFDRLARMFAALATRRRIGRLLSAVPLSGAVTALLAAESAAARRRRVRQRHDDRRERLQAQRKKKKTKKCAKAGQPTTKKRKRCCKGLVKDSSGRCAQPAGACTPASCAPNACGSVPDGCGGTLSCGGCTGNTLCVSGVCQPCHVCASGCSFTTVQDAVDFALPGATIRLCAGLYAGDIDIDKRLNLIGAGDGNGAGDTVLEGSGTDTVMIIAFGVQRVALEHLRITGGNTTGDGGGIRSAAITVLVTDCTVSGNAADRGGGIFSGTGALTLTGCAVSGNGASSGGGIFNQGGALTLHGCTITGNSADFGGGGIDNTLGSALTLTDSTVSGNASDNSGGGIHNQSGSTLALINSTVTGNTADFFGGGLFNGASSTLTLTDSTVSENTVFFQGGGIWNGNSAAVTLDAASRVTDNHADPGNINPCGGIFNQNGTVTLASAANVSGNTPNNCCGDPVPLCVG